MIQLQATMRRGPWPMPEFHLSLLGGLDIAAEAADQPLTRKARAMLAYLAMHAGKPQSREKLAALFWGRNGESQARTNLRQALSALRRALPAGDGARLVTEGDRVALDLDGGGLDVARFEALAAGRQPEELEQAAALYRGDLLDGFSVREPGFEEWVGAERERLRLVAIGALERLVSHYRDAQEFGRCAQTALRLLALDALREDIHRALMRTYATQGRVGLALKQYETCRDILRRELGVEPEPETRQLFEELRARRERSNESQPSEQGAARRPVLIAAPPLPERPSVAVLRFEDASDDPEQTYFSEGITENIITGLARFRDLFVIGLKSSLMARDRTTDVREIGRQLGVAHVVEGSVRRVGDHVRVTVQLIDAASAHRVWAEQYDRRLAEIFAVEDEITDVIVATLV
jgi:TolB-like protein